MTMRLPRLRWRSPFRVVALEDLDVLHVYPVNDVVAHDLTLDTGHECVCGPRVEAVGGCWIVTHYPLSIDVPALR